MRLTAATLVGLGAALACAPPAQAQVDLFSRQTISGLVELRVTASDGETSWTRGGQGKALGGGGDPAFRADLDLATIAWRPELGWDLSGYVTAQAQPGQDHGIDIAEGFVAWRPLPVHGVKFSARAGLMWPPASLEHDGVAWTTTRTLTPSAINTWIAEEVKVVAVEGSASGEFGGHRFSATLAAFEDNDTSGTILSYRGWALDDLRTTAFGTLPMPHFPTPPKHSRQNDEIDPSLELDGRVGGYAKLEWRPPAPVAVEAFYYDNAGVPSINKNGQWGWRTSFADLGVTWRPAPDVEVLAQAMQGRTYYGLLTPNGYFIDIEFASAYVLATKVSGRHRFTGRADYFDIDDRSFRAFDDNSERGWAATGDYAYALTPHLSLWVEAMDVWSERASRAYVGVAPAQPQTVVQLALRAKF